MSEEKKIQDKYIQKALKYQEKALKGIQKNMTENAALFLCAMYNAELARCYQKIEELENDQKY